MARFDYNGDSLRLEHLRKCESDLLGEAFLDLESSCEHLSDARKLGETNDSAVGDVAYVHLLRVSDQTCLSLAESIPSP